MYVFALKKGSNCCTDTVVLASSPAGGVHSIVVDVTLGSSHSFSPTYTEYTLSESPSVKFFPCTFRKKSVQMLFWIYEKLRGMFWDAEAEITSCQLFCFGGTVECRTISVVEFSFGDSLREHLQGHLHPCEVG